MAETLFDDKTGVPMVWTLDCGTVKCRPKKNVDKEIREKWFRGSVHSSEVAAREAHVQRCEQAMADAYQAAHRAEKAVAEARKRLKEAEEREAQP